MVIQKKQKDIKVNNSKIMLSWNWLFEPTMNYYKIAYNMDYVENIVQLDINKNAKFIYTFETDSIFIENYSDGYVLVEKTNMQSDIGNASTVLVENKRIDFWGNKKKQLINILAPNGRYLFENRNEQSKLTATSDKSWGWETFEIVFYDQQKICLLTSDGKMLSINDVNNSELIVNNKQELAPILFDLVELNSDTVAFRAYNKKHLTLEYADFKLYAKSVSIGLAQKFVLIKH